MDAPPKMIELANQIAEGVHRQQFLKIQNNSESESSMCDEAVSLGRFLVHKDDRLLAIMSASFLEDILKTTFIYQWNISKSKQDSFFGTNGPLSTFSNRCLIAKSLNWLSDEDYAHVNIIRKLRNEFAHNHRIVNFGQKNVADLFKGLKPAEEIWAIKDLMA